VLDQRRAAELTLRHLYQLGHRKIAFMRGGSHSSDADDRWECLMAVARELKLEVAPKLTVQLQLRVSTPELGYGPASQLLDSGVHFTALVCYDDLAAIGAIRPLWTMACGCRRTSPWWASTTSRARRTTTPA